MSHNKPLMLKDYLELDSNSDSIDQYASMRHLLQVELRSGSGRRQLIRTRSKNALLKLSSLMKLDFLLLSCSPSSINKRPRSRNMLKKNQSGSFAFWKKRGTTDHEVEDVRVKDIVRLTSFNITTCSSSSWSESDFTGSDFLPSSNGSSEFIPDIITDADDSHGGSDKKVVTRDEEEKDQLCPISVMDFPYDEEEEEETADEGISDSSSFQENLASIERARQALLQKIRRFESLAELVPVNLDNQFSDVDEESSRNPASDDDDVNEEETTVEMQAWKLLNHIKSNSPIRIEGCIEKLLLEFFVEGLNCNTRNDSFATKLVDAAKKWIESRSDCWEQRDNCGEMEIGQMDWNGRFRSCFEEEQQEVAVCLTSGVLGCLMDEFVGELVFC
ncbi:hypothetical protein FCM35_KLT15942 [Carex littledalei]|uniref:DUF4378 domain-containing protein n=1 Tax=Carex littledalei TaxID=544730 RepID=A0A833RJ97_9POAL|nr:hypothetical protein FCM35_KLT15942 [Carex littledalei]